MSELNVWYFGGGNNWPDLTSHCYVHLEQQLLRVLVITVRVLPTLMIVTQTSRQTIAGRLASYANYIKR